MGSATSPPRPVLAVTSVRIERDKLDRFKELAHSHRRTVSQELNWLIDQALDGADTEGAPA